MSTNAINPAAYPAVSSSTSNTSSTSNSSTDYDSMFMKLLVTQLQNQDPTQPMDPSTFVSQLVEVNSLGQLTQINQLLTNTFGSTSGSSNNSTAGGQ